MNKPKICIQLLISFAKVGTFVVGGGYSMVPVMRYEIVEKRKWINDDEILDCMALGQSLPGVITINTSVFIGYRVCGIMGALAASLGIVFPAFLIITLFAAAFEKLESMVVVQKAMAGVRASVFALILASVLKMFNSSVKNIFQMIIFLGVFGFMMFSDISPVFAIIVSGLLGYIYFLKRGENSD